jgi:hypothetical protein
VTAALLMGWNSQVFGYGAVAQPYGLCLLLLVAGYWMAVRTVERPGTALAAGTGLAAGGAAGASLLTAAAAPVFLVWLLAFNRAGNRWKKAAAMAAGVAVPFAPVAWALARGPRATWFNLVEYHLRYRRLYWPGATRHDLEVLFSWIDCGQALVLGLLALVGILFVLRRSGWERARKAEFHLALWLALGLAAELSRGHPTFPQYFLLVVPWLAILGAAGLYAASGRGWAVALVGLVMALGLVKSLYDARNDATWADYEAVAARIEEVTPRTSPLLADEMMYFLTRRTPPEGFELYYTHKLGLPPAARTLFHLVDEEGVRRERLSGRYATVYIDGDAEVAGAGLDAVYRRREEVGDCTLFWDPGPR